MEFLLSLANLILMFELESNEFLLCLNNFVFLDNLGFFFRLTEKPLAIKSEYKVAYQCSEQQETQGY
jgi:hypothetical protein